jgi:peroxiredoxin
MSNESMAVEFAALQSHREQTWDPAQLQKNIDQRRKLVEAYDAKRHIQVGETPAPFTLLDVDGGVITRDDLVRFGPAVVIFFRFAGCPACNIALPYYERELWPALKAAGVRLVAVSPQVPEKLVDIKIRHDLGFIVASDPDNRLGKALGITFDSDTAPPPVGADWIGSLTGTNSWTLPQPTILILNEDASIKFIDVSPDWLTRSDAATILAEISKVRTPA